MSGVQEQIDSWLIYRLPRALYAFAMNITNGHMKSSPQNCTDKIKDYLPSNTNKTLEANICRNKTLGLF